MNKSVVSVIFAGPNLEMQSYTVVPGNRVANKDDPKCTQCHKRYCTYNERLCLKCHNLTHPVCQGCHKKKFVQSNDRCYDCNTQVVTISQ